MNSMRQTSNSVVSRLTRIPGMGVKCARCLHSSPIHDAKGVCRACGYSIQGQRGPCAHPVIPPLQRPLEAFM